MPVTTTKTIPTTYATSVDHLLAGLAYIDLRIRWAVARARASGLDPQDEFRGLYVSDVQVDTMLGYELGEHTWLGNGRSHNNGSSADDWPMRIAQARSKWQQRTSASLAAGLHLTFTHLQRAFNLSAIETDAFLIALAPELDPRYERIFAYLQDDVTKKRPSIDLILNLLTDSYGEKLQLRELFGTNGRLIQSRLLTRFANPSDRQPTLLAHYLRPAPTVVEHLLDQFTLDDQLDGIAHISLPNLHALISSPNRLTSEFHHHLHTANQTTPAPIFAFIGGYGVGKQEAAQYLAAAAERPLVQLNLATLQESEIGLQEGLARVLRDGRLHQATLYLTNWDVLLPDGRIPTDHFHALLSYPHTIVIASEATWQAGQRNVTRPIFPITFPTPNYERRLAIWQTHLETAVDLDLRPLANHFRFTPGQIAAAAATAHDLAQWRGETMTTADLFTASRLHSNQKLATLATKITPRYTWDEIVLPDDTLAQLREMVNVVQQRPIVYGQWGFGQKQSLGKGLNALFAGESGTGKTMSDGVVPARRIAVALDIRLHEGVDLFTRQPALGAPGWILAVLAEAGEPGDFILVNLRIGVENARAAAVLVERTIAQLVENGAGGCALQHTQRPETVGDDGDQPGCQPHLLFAEAGLPARVAYDFGQFRQRHDVAADIAVGDQRTQKRAGIIG
jgi:hypothetical protein